MYGGLEGWGLGGKRTRKPKVCFGLVLDDFKQDIGEAWMLLGLGLDMLVKEGKGGIHKKSIQQAELYMVGGSPEVGGMEMYGDGRWMGY